MVEIIPADEFDASRDDNYPEPYQEFRDVQGIPVHFRHHASDVVFAGDNSVFDFKADYNIIDYPDEDPEIREMFETELRERGRKSKMPKRLYREGSKSFFRDE